MLVNLTELTVSYCRYFPYQIMF